MNSYLIHGCNKRWWYINKFLVPSMLEQGIDIDAIKIYQDAGHVGNLFSTMDSYAELPDKGSTWHLQDDIILSSWFKKQTELDWKDKIVCGFCNRFSRENPAGEATAKTMWMSFQCILIPNYIAKDCAKWFYKDVLHNKEYRLWVQQRKYDDSIFKIFVQDYYPDVEVYHIAPNIVDHIDYLIGGSTINQCRCEDARSIYWSEETLVNELEGKLKCQYGQ